MLKVIIADDDVNVRTGLKNVISWNQLGAEVVLLAKDGKQVKDYLVDHRVDVIISDVKMPFVDGLELSEHVKNQYPFTKMVLMSAFTDFEYCQKALQHGVTEYIVKPIGRDKVKQITNIIKQKVLEAELQLRSDQLLYTKPLANELKDVMLGKDPEELKLFLTQKEEQLPRTVAAFRVFYLFVLNMFYEISRQKDVQLTDSGLYRRFNELRSLDDYCEFICRELEQYYRQEAPKAEKADKMLVADKIKDFIDENFSLSNLSVGFLSERLHVSIHYAGTAFKSKYLMTINEYIFIKRMEKACEEIKNTRQTVAAVSKSVGYMDVQYFTKLFKKYTGISPTAYREKILNGEDITKLKEV